MQRTILAALVFFLACWTSAGAAEIKVGHVDLQRIVSNSEAGKQAREQYFVRTQKYQNEINARSEKLRQLKETIEKQAKGLKQGETIPAALLEEDKEYAAQARELQRLLGAYQEELKVYDQELTKKVLDAFTPILADYAVQNGYDYIFSRLDFFIFGAERRDLTPALIKEFDARWKKEGKDARL